MSPAPVHIHVGAHKAGSTTIQFFCRDNESALARVGIVYPAVGRSGGGAHHMLAAGLHELDRGNGRGAEIWQSVRELREGLQPGVRLLLSSERFENLTREAIARLPALIGGGEIRIHAYVRDIPGAIVSAYGQRTKVGHNTLDFDRFFRRYVERVCEGRLEMIRNFAGVFGPEHCRVQLLDQKALFGGDLMRDLMHALGVDFDALKVGPAPRGNVSPGWKVTEALRAIWLNMPTDAARSDVLVLLERIRRASESAATALGTERGEYLTLQQRARCNTLTQAMLSEINTLLPGHSLSVPIAAEPVDRPFLPTIEHASTAEIVTFFAKMIPILAEGDQPVRRAVPAAAHGAAPDPTRKRSAARTEKPRDPDARPRLDRVSDASAPRQPRPDRAAMRQAKAASTGGNTGRRRPEPVQCTDAVGTPPGRPVTGPAAAPGQRAPRVAEQSLQNTMRAERHAHFARKRGA